MYIDQQRNVIFSVAIFWPFGCKISVYNTKVVERFGNYMYVTDRPEDRHTDLTEIVCKSLARFQCSECGKLSHNTAFGRIIVTLTELADLRMNT